MSERVIRLIDRSRIVQDWKCPRSRYFGYEYEGRGITKSMTSLELYMGITVHDALAAIAILTKEGKAVDIDAIAQAAYHQMFDNIMDGADLIPESQAVQFAQEQATLTEGMIRGYFKHVWPILMQDHAGIVAVEAEMKYKLADDLIFMAKPDLILEDKEGDFVYCVDPYTKILTSSLNWIKASDIKVGAELIGVEEQPTKAGLDKNGQSRRAARQWNTGRVTKVSTVRKNRYRLTLSDGTAVVCSDDHQWLVPLQRGRFERGGTLNAEWRSTSDLKEGAKLLKIIQPWKNDEWDPYEAGYLAAALDGEGSLSQIKKSKAMAITFTQKNNSMLHEVKRILVKYGVKFGETIRSGDKVSCVYVSSKPQIFRLMGLIKPKRLIEKLDFNAVGGAFPITLVKIEKKESLGMGNVVAIETTNHTFIAEGIISHNCEYKTTSSKKESWTNSWNTAVQLHSSIMATEQTLGKRPSSVRIVGLYKGYESYGKQSSPFCYAYKKSGNPPFTEDQISYEYRAGFKRYPTWELPGGVKDWIDKMPSNVLADQFPMTAPIFVDERLVEGFFRQTIARERAIQTGGDIDVVYPQRFDQCVPYFGKPCQFRPICHGGVVNPLEDGFTYREPHHEAEMKALGLDHDEY